MTRDNSTYILGFGPYGGKILEFDLSVGGVHMTSESGSINITYQKRKKKEAQ